MYFIEQLCALCLNQISSTTNKNDYSEGTIIQKISLCFPEFKINQFTAPVYVCQNCENQLSLFCHFKSLGLKNLNNYRKFINILKRKKKNNYLVLNVVTDPIPKEQEAKLRKHKISEPTIESDVTDNQENLNTVTKKSKLEKDKCLTVKLTKIKIANNKVVHSEEQIKIENIDDSIQNEQNLDSIPVNQKIELDKNLVIDTEVSNENSVSKQNKTNVKINTNKKTTDSKKQNKKLKENFENQANLKENNKIIENIDGSIQNSSLKNLDLIPDNQKIELDKNLVIDTEVSSQDSVSKQNKTNVKINTNQNTTVSKKQNKKLKENFENQTNLKETNKIIENIDGSFQNQKNLNSIPDNQKIELNENQNSVSLQNKRNSKINTSKSELKKNLVKKAKIANQNLIVKNQNNDNSVLIKQNNSKTENSNVGEQIQSNLSSVKQKSRIEKELEKNKNINDQINDNWEKIKQKCVEKGKMKLENEKLKNTESSNQNSTSNNQSYQQKTLDIEQTLRKTTQLNENFFVNKLITNAEKQNKKNKDLTIRNREIPVQNFQNIPIQNFQNIPAKNLDNNGMNDSHEILPAIPENELDVTQNQSYNSLFLWNSMFVKQELMELDENLTFSNVEIENNDLNDFKQEILDNYEENNQQPSEESQVQNFIHHIFDVSDVCSNNIDNRNDVSSEMAEYVTYNELMSNIKYINRENQETDNLNSNVNQEKIQPIPNKIVPKDKPRKIYQCDLCPKTFLFSRSRKDHMNSHLGVCPYVCIICQKSYSRKESLRKHMYTHKTEKPHKCDICEKGFYEKSKLLKHMNTHCNKEPLVCTFCLQTFKYKSTFLKHMNSHATSPS